MPSNDKSDFLNTAIPIGFLAVLNLLAIITMWCNVARLDATDFLAWFAVIGLTVGYFWVVRPFAPKAAEQVESAKQAPAVDLAKVHEVAARLDQIVGDVEYLKRSSADLKALKQQIAAIEQSAVSPESLRAEIARLRDQIGVIHKLAGEVSLLKDTVGQLGKKKGDGEVQVAEIERLSTALSAIEQQLRQGEGGADVALKKLAAEVEALEQNEQSRESKIREMAEILHRVEDALNQSQADLNCKATKEEIAAVQQEVGAAAAARDEIARFNGELARLQDLSADVAKLKELAQDHTASEKVQKTLQTTKKKLGDSIEDLKTQFKALQADMSRMPNAQTVLSLRTDIDKKLEDFRTDLDERVNAAQLQEMANRMMAEVASMRQAVKDLQNSKMADEVEQIKGRLDKAVQVADVEKLARSVKEKFAEVSRDVAALGDQLGQMGDKVRDLERLKETEKAVADIRADVEEARSGLQELSRKDDIRPQLALIEKRVDSLTEELSRLSVGAQRKADDLEETFRTSLATMKAQVDEAQKSAQCDPDLARKVAAIDDEVSSLREALTSMQQIRKDLAETKSQFSSLRRELTSLQDISSQMEEWKADVEEKLAAAESRSETAGPREDLEDAVAEVHRKISEVEMLAKQAADAGKINGLSNKLADVAEKLDALARDTERIDKLAGELGALAVQIEEVPTRKAVEEQLSHLQNQQDHLARTVKGLSEAEGRINDLEKTVADDVGRLRTRLDALSQIEEQVAGISKIENALDDLRKGLSDAAAKDATSDAISDLQRRINQLQLSIGKASGAEDVEEISARQGEALSDLRKHVDQLSAASREQIQEMKNALDAQAHRLETIEHEGSRTARELADSVRERTAEAEAVSSAQERIDAIRQEFAAAIDGIRSRVDEKTSAAAQIMDERLALLRQAVDVMEQELHSLGERQGSEHLAEQLRGQLDEIRTGLDEIRLRMDEQIAQVTARIFEETERLRAEKGTREETPSQSDAIAQEIQFLREGLSVLEQVAAHVAAPEAASAGAAVATATPGTQLVIHMKESKMTRTKDGTQIECRLTISNPSETPMEIIAVRGELDSGKERMTPTVNKYWLPAGVEPDRDRSLALPFRVLDNATSQEILYTVTGWPLEKSKESYDFRIVLLDENKGKHTGVFPLSPPE
ncbi:MAG: hypothetical protein AB1696_00620 [Planctomycetota bacterium]